MRQLLMLIVVAAAIYLGYTYYQQRVAAPVEVADDAPAETIPSESQPIIPATPAPAIFKSKIQIADTATGEKHLAPPGIFYMRERVSAETQTGIHAVVPGEKVLLLKRNGDGTLRLSHELVEFTVKDSQVTNDLDEAQEAEKQEFLKRTKR